MHKSAREILNAFPGQTVLVVGDVMLDEYVWGDVRRISPEAPVPVVEIRRRSFAPGGASNTAVNVTSLGGRALLAGVVGRDPYAAQLWEELAKRGVETGGLIADKDRMTTAKTRVVAHSQQLVRIDCEHPSVLTRGQEDELLEWIEKQLPRASACILSDYAKGVVTTKLAQGLLQAARKAGKPVIVDPKGADYSKYRGATVIKPNIHEAERASKVEVTSPSSLPEVARQLLNILEGGSILLTRGAEGMTLFRREAEPVHIAAMARDVFDVTGAGDTVAGTLALALAAGATLEQAADLANRAAGIVVGKVGTSTVSPEELLRTLDE
jgi:rfaE bifunctional protein kinase chain/domain